jgi:hypothetical protein
VGWPGIEDSGTDGSAGSRLCGISGGQLGLGSPNRLGGDKSDEEKGDDGDERDHPQQGAQRGRRTSLLLSLPNPAWSGGTFAF